MFYDGMRDAVLDAVTVAYDYSCDLLLEYAAAGGPEFVFTPLKRHFPLHGLGFLCVSAQLEMKSLLYPSLRLLCVDHVSTASLVAGIASSHQKVVASRPGQRVHVTFRRI